MAYEEERFDLKSIADIMVAMQEKQKAAEQNIEDWGRLNEALKVALAPVEGNEEFAGLKVNQSENGPVSSRREWIQTMTDSVTAVAHDQSAEAYDANPYNTNGVPYYAEYGDTENGIQDQSLEEIAETKIDAINELADIAYDVDAECAPELEAYAQRLEIIVEDGMQDVDGNAELREAMANIDDINHQMQNHTILEARGNEAHNELSDLREQGITLDNYDYGNDSPTPEDDDEIVF